MSTTLTFLLYDERVKHIFDHEVREPEWYWDLDVPEWRAPSELTIQYLTALFGDPLPSLAPYTNAQLNQGFWYLIKPVCSNYMFAVTDESVPLDLRIDCVRSITQVFEQLFSGRCSAHLSHLNENGAAPLNLVCYMWWDLVRDLREPGEPAKEAISRAALEVMKATLRLNSIACQESALHGLGHWELFYPTEVAAIVDQYLNDNPHLRTELKDYALKAREGHVL